MLSIINLSLPCADRCKEYPRITALISIHGTKLLTRGTFPVRSAGRELILIIKKMVSTTLPSISGTCLRAERNTNGLSQVHPETGRIYGRMARHMRPHPGQEERHLHEL